MPTFRTTIANKTFDSCVDGDYADDADAVQEAVQGAIAIGAEEVRNGEPLFMAEITVESEGRLVEHRVIVIGSSPLA